MRKYLTLVLLVTLGTLGYTVQAVYGNDMTSTTMNMTFAEKTYGQPSPLWVQSANDSAEMFAEAVDTLGRLEASGALTTTHVLVLRSIISDHFHEAFTTITYLEDRGRFVEAAPAREIMEIAINDYMQNVPQSVPNITRDLEAFSKFMTETLIERSAEATS